MKRPSTPINFEKNFVVTCMIENKETKFCPSPSEAPVLTAINDVLYLYGGLSDRIWNILYSYNFGNKLDFILLEIFFWEKKKIHKSEK